MVTGVGTETGWVLIRNVTLLAPAGAVTVAGTTAAGLLPVRVMTSPPGRAGCASTICPSAGWPPSAGLGKRKSCALFVGTGVGAGVTVTGGSNSTT